MLIPVLSIVMLSVFSSNVNMLSSITPIAIQLSILRLTVTKQSVIMLQVVAPPGLRRPICNINSC
jgi:hypothetical protein